jgi:hypothetical protein
LRKRSDSGKLGGIEIEKHLAADGLHLLPRDVDRDRASIGDDLQFGERGNHVGQSALQRHQRPSDLFGGDAVLAKLLQSAQCD